MSGITDVAQKLQMLTNFVSPTIYEFIADATVFDNAMSTLESLYVTPKNKVFARYLLATRKQQNGETLDEYLNKLKLLSKD